MRRSACLAVLAGMTALTAAVAAVEVQRARAESPLEFFTNQHRRAAPSYSREPVHVRPRGLFRGLFEYFDRDLPPPRRHTEASAGLERVICKRQCDGAQLVLGILPARKSRAEAEAMCVAAGGGAKVELVEEKFEPGAGFAPPPPLQTASTGEPPLLEGRAALDTSITGTPAPKKLEGACPPSAERKPFMMVPILHDATLKRGDVVATRDGFKVFVGRGDPPFSDSDFVDIDKRKGVAKAIRELRIADR